MSTKRSIEQVTSTSTLKKQKISKELNVEYVLAYLRQQATGKDVMKSILFTKKHNTIFIIMYLRYYKEENMHEQVKKIQQLEFDEEKNEFVARGATVIALKNNTSEGLEFPDYTHMQHVVESAQLGKDIKQKKQDGELFPIPGYPSKEIYWKFTQDGIYVIPPDDVELVSI